MNCSIENNKVCIIGNKGNLGRFFEKELIPLLNVRQVFGFDIDTDRSSKERLIDESTDIVICAPLGKYTTTTKNLIQYLSKKNEKKTLWLVPSVQEPVAKLVEFAYQELPISHISIVVVHPMYGPDSFIDKPLLNVITKVFNHQFITQQFSQLMSDVLNAETSTQFSPKQHDEITAKSQGLVYIFSKVALGDEIIASQLKKNHLKFYQSIFSDKGLIDSFLNENKYCSDIIKYFYQHWDNKKNKTLGDLLKSFKEVDAIVNKTENQIPLEQYNYLKNLQ